MCFLILRNDQLGFSSFEVNVDAYNVNNEVPYIARLNLVLAQSVITLSEIWVFKIWYNVFTRAFDIEHDREER